MKTQKQFLNSISFSELFRVIASFFITIILVLHIVGLNVPITYFPRCFSMFVLQNNECSIVVKILGFFFGLSPFLLILVLSDKFNRLLSRAILYAWLLIDIIFIIAGFNPTEYSSYNTLFHGWHPVPAILFDLFLLCWVLSCSQSISLQIKSRGK